MKSEGIHHKTKYIFKMLKHILLYGYDNNM